MKDIVSSIKNMDANKLVEDDLITSGNQYIYMTYHALKEAYQLKVLNVHMKKTKLNLADLSQLQKRRERIKGVTWGWRFKEKGCCKGGRA